MKRHNATCWTAAATALLLAAAGCSTTSSKTATTAAEKPAPKESVERSVQMESTEAKVTLEPVYFDTDRWTLGDKAQRTLRSNAKAILANTAWGTLTIEGHCDERGSDEYNLALGERRANAVARYLMDLGVPSSRVRTVSFGEQKPAVQGHDESAWRYNRRSVVQQQSHQASR